MKLKAAELELSVTKSMSNHDEPRPDNSRCIYGIARCRSVNDSENRDSARPLSSQRRSIHAVCMYESDVGAPHCSNPGYGRYPCAGPKLLDLFITSFAMELVDGPCFNMPRFLGSLPHCELDLARGLSPLKNSLTTKDGSKPSRR